MHQQGFPGQPDKLLIDVAVKRRTLARAMSALGSAGDTEVVARYQQLIAAVEQAFKAEEMATEHFNHCALHEQRERHARVLSGLHQACTRIEAGDFALAREALELLSRFLLMQGPSGQLAPAATGHPVQPRRRMVRPVRLARPRRPVPLPRVPGL